MRALFLCAAVAALCACATPRGATVSAPENQSMLPQTPAPDIAKREVRLSPGATQQDFAAFQKTVESVYVASLAGEAEPGFSYSLSPAGAANPFSAIEVACLMPEEHADKSLRQCKKFLGMLEQ